MIHPRNLTMRRTQWEWVDPAILDRAAAYQAVTEAEAILRQADRPSQPDLTQSADH